MNTRVTIRELAAWDFDMYPWRDQFFYPALLDQRATVAATRLGHEAPSHEPFGTEALLAEETRLHKAILEEQRLRPTLLAEMRGLDWSLGVVDLRRLIAFQRRLVLDPEAPAAHIPKQEDWTGLCDLAFGGVRNMAHRVNVSSSDGNGYTIQLHSTNPDLRIALTESSPEGTLPLMLTGGGPFFEVAEFRERWFLRDGYHRAYRMLRAGVTKGFAVIVHARTLEEMGAVEPFFFGEETLFAARPPRVIDFLEEDLVLTYERLRMRKTISVHIEESLEPVTDSVTNEYVASGGTE
jgi:hypothetical protein